MKIPGILTNSNDAEAHDAKIGLTPYQKHLTKAARKKLRNRKRGVLQKKSRRRNR